MRKIYTKFKGLFLLKTKIFYDSRGFFREIFHNKKIKKKVVFGCASKSKKNVLRGMHIQTKRSQLKIVTVLKGKIYDVALDLRPKSKTFKKAFTTELSEKNGKYLIIPEGFAHGFLSLSNETIVYYLCNNYREKKNEIGIIWNDPDIKINWPIKRPILSKKDKNNLTLNEYLKKYN